MMQTTAGARVQGLCDLADDGAHLGGLQPLADQSR